MKIFSDKESVVEENENQLIPSRYYREIREFLECAILALIMVLLIILMLLGAVVVAFGVAYLVG